MNLLSKFVNDLDRNAQADIAQRSASIGQGGCANMETYKELCGVNKGMNRAVDLARQMLRQLEIDAEEAHLGEMNPPGKKKAS